MADRVGQQLDDYRLVRLLGAGTFGEVYLGEHVYYQTQVAVKVLKIHLTPDTLKEFLNEARTVRLKHPHIIQIMDFGIADDTPFIVMDYAPNGTLRQCHPQGTRLPLQNTLSYVKQVASALQYAHDMRLIHRDVKPQNMLLGHNNEVRLSDFGIAVVAHTERSLTTLEMAGTVPYMAPEQIRGRPRPASDQYALGIVVYEWLCGTRPFRGSQWEIIEQQLSVPPPPLREKVPTIPPAVEQVVLTALNKDPQQRFASVQAFANALEQASKLETSLPSASAFVSSPPPVIPVSSPTATPLSAPSIHQSPPAPAPPTFQVKQLDEANALSDFQPPGTSMPAISRVDDDRSSPSYPLSSPSISSASVISPQADLPTSRQKRSRLFYPTLASLVLLVVVMISGGAYVVLHLNTGPGVAQSLQQAQALITQANGEVSSNPALALQHLASAQKTLQGLLSSQLSDTQHTQATRLLQGDLTTTTRVAIHNYNQRALVTTLPCPSVSTATTINDGGTGTHAQRLATVQNMTYALGQDGKVYQLKQLSGQIGLTSPLVFPGNAQAVDITSGDAELAILLKESTTNSYVLGLLQPGQQQLKTLASIDKTLFVNGQTPTLVAAGGTDVYVVLTSPPAANAAQNALLLDFTVDTAKGTLKVGPRGTQLSLTSTIASLAALPNHVLFLSLANGSVQSLQWITTGPAPLPIKAPSPTNVLVQQPIAPSLGIGEAAFTPATPVPTVATPAAQAGETQLTVSSPATLSMGLAGNVPHLYIADTAHRRLLDLQPAANAGASTPIRLQLVRQYVSSDLLAQMKSLTLNSSSGVAYILTQKNQALFSLVSVSMNAQAQDTCL
jgi:serine/threonine protein kinase